MRCILILTTVPSKKDGQKIAGRLLRGKAAACVTISSPVESHYWWRKKIEKSKEWMLFIKTQKRLYGKAEKIILKAHPYDVPEIISLPVGKVSSKYLSWIKNSTGL